MLVITNRNLSKDFASSGVGDEKAFGEQINVDGPNEVRLANAKKLVVIGLLNWSKSQKI
ncbi:MAG: hypothetical protein JG718_09945 [Candidatus Thiothrix moscowensis]|nr:hypothetical protein [Candidatus Thiothrix moscowensis]